MTPKNAYIEWLDREMEVAAFVVNAESYTPEARTQNANKHFILRQAKEKFLSLYPSQTIDSQEVDTDEARQFTDGLD